VFRMIRHGLVWVWHLELQRRGGGGTLGGGWAFRIVHSAAFGDRHVVPRSAVRRLSALTPKLLVGLGGHVMPCACVQSVRRGEVLGVAPRLSSNEGSLLAPRPSPFSLSWQVAALCRVRRHAARDGRGPWRSFPPVDAAYLGAGSAPVAGVSARNAQGTLEVKGDGGLGSERCIRWRIEQ
jgi:hypothetical protein